LEGLIRDLDSDKPRSHGTPICAPPAASAVCRRRLVKAIHKKFQDEYGCKEIEPQLFSIKQYQFELEQIFEEGEAFRNSARTTMTEQSIVINKLYSTLINRARAILKTANKDATTWCNSVLTPLMHQIKDHKKQIESRLQMLRKINDSKGSVAENIAQLEQELEPLKRQRNELSIIIKAMQMEPPPSMIENKIN
jgi:ABC-type phosphate transport system auxiliary subunit